MTSLTALQYRLLAEEMRAIAAAAPNERIRQGRQRLLRRSHNDSGADGTAQAVAPGGRNFKLATAWER